MDPKFSRDPKREPRFVRPEAETPEERLKLLREEVEETARCVRTVETIAEKWQSIVGAEKNWNGLNAEQMWQKYGGRISEAMREARKESDERVAKYEQRLQYAEQKYKNPRAVMAQNPVVWDRKTEFQLCNFDTCDLADVVKTGEHGSAGRGLIMNRLTNKAAEIEDKMAALLGMKKQIPPDLVDRGPAAVSWVALKEMPKTKGGGFRKTNILEEALEKLKAKKGVDPEKLRELSELKQQRDELDRIFVLLAKYGALFQGKRSHDPTFLTTTEIIKILRENGIIERHESLHESWLRLRDVGIPGRPTAFDGLKRKIGDLTVEARGDAEIERQTRELLTQMQNLERKAGTLAVPLRHIAAEAKRVKDMTPEAFAAENAKAAASQKKSAGSQTTNQPGGNGRGQTQITQSKKPATPITHNKPSQRPAEASREGGSRPVTTSHEGGSRRDRGGERRAPAQPSSRGEPILASAHMSQEIADVISNIRRGVPVLEAFAEQKKPPRKERKERGGGRNPAPKPRRSSREKADYKKFEGKVEQDGEE